MYLNTTPFSDHANSKKKGMTGGEDCLDEEEDELINVENDEDETNTVIENECDNDYGNIYTSMGEED
jgi:hypothetical protein